MGTKQSQDTNNIGQMGWSAPVSAPLCPVCNKSVFATEAYYAADRTPYHTRCLKCQAKCNKKLTPATLNEHNKKLYCRNCYEDTFLDKDDDIPDRTVMQVLPREGAFIVEPKPVNNNLSPEELQRRKEAEEAAKAWAEASGGGYMSDFHAVKIKETCAIAPDDTYFI